MRHSTVRRPDIVLITIPSAAPDRLAKIIGACEARELDCRVVRREVDVDPRVILEPRTRWDAKPTKLDRLLAAYPLVSVYLLLLFALRLADDADRVALDLHYELNWSLLSRAIAHTGHPELRGHPAPFGSLYAIPPRRRGGRAGPHRHTQSRNT